MEVIFELLGELFLQIGAHAFATAGEHTVAAHRRKGASNHALSILGHVFFGAGIGALTLLIWRHSLLPSETWRIVNLIGSPILAGLGSMLIGYFYRRNGDERIPLARFGYGFLFAGSFALVRFLATR